MGWSVEKHRQRLQAKLLQHVRLLSEEERKKLKSFEDSTLNVVCVVRALTAAERDLLRGKTS